VPISGGTPSTLVPSALRARYARSGHLVFWDPGRGEMRAAAFDPVTLAIGQTSVGLGSSVDSGTLVQTGDSQPAFEISDEGTLVYATGAFFDENFSVVLVDSTGRSTPLIDELASWAQPRVSPDGRTLLLRKAATPECSLWLFDLNRRSLSRFSQDGDHHNPLWSHDGRAVVASYQSAAGIRQVYEQSIDGSARRPLVPTSFPALAESISPDGRYLALTYDARRERNDILVHDRRTGETTPLLTSDFDEDYPAFSPNGGLLAYVSTETGRPEVYVRPFPASGLKQRISTEGGTGPLWSHDGRALYYAEGSRMMQVTVAMSPSFTAGTPEPLFEGAEFVWDRPGNYEVLADNKTFVMVRRSRLGGAERRLRVVFGWFEELNRLVPIE
jgi:Tol biopolymer transport system component